MSLFAAIIETLTNNNSQHNASDFDTISVFKCENPLLNTVIILFYVQV